MPKAPSTVHFVSEEPDAYWDQIAAHVQHETNMYRKWADKAGVHSPYLHFEETDELRASGAYQVLTPEQLIDEARGMVPNQPIMFHPLCGGIRPALAWQSLELFKARVLPTLKKENLLI